uniref:Lipocalin/cytosolic fatty-acid binding domain-containing protein n=1 Tax=Pelusios castaneus TaxID=367368 RepID=A0A8C8RG01_9SAUR
MAQLHKGLVGPAGFCIRYFLRSLPTLIFYDSTYWIQHPHWDSGHLDFARFCHRLLTNHGRIMFALWASVSPWFQWGSSCWEEGASSALSQCGVKSSEAIFTFTPEGNLHFQIGYPTGVQTLQLSGIIWFLLAEKGKGDLRVMETDYEDYAIVYTFRDDGLESGTTLQLFSRTQEISPQAMKRLTELYPAQGLTRDMLLLLPKSGKCLRHRVHFSPCSARLGH